jgi:hypothetical protein
MKKTTTTTTSTSRKITKGIRPEAQPTRLACGSYIM